MMNYLVRNLFLVACICVVVFGTELPESFYSAQEVQTLELCSQEYGTYINYTEFTISGSLPDEKHRNSKCLFYCVPAKLGVTDQNGTVNQIQIKDMMVTRYPGLQEPIAKAVVKKCTRRRDRDVCDKWYYITKCIWNMYLNHKSKEEAKNKRRNKIHGHHKAQISTF